MRTFSAAMIASALTLASVEAEPIIIVPSWNSPEHAVVACRHVREVLIRTVPDDPHVRAALAECNLAGDGSNLGIQLEQEVLKAMAISTRCRGVTIFRETREPNNFSELEPHRRRFHWDLLLNYVPGYRAHSWVLAPINGQGRTEGAAQRGEEVPVQIAEHVCIIVTGQGATIR